jgi:hypothetical protein
MQLQPFLLDMWLDNYEHDIEFNLASSTGPSWTINAVLNLAGEEERRRFLNHELVYGRPAGADGLREAIADMHDVSTECVQVDAHEASLPYLPSLVWSRRAAQSRHLHIARPAAQLRHAHHRADVACRERGDEANSSVRCGPRCALPVIDIRSAHDIVAASARPQQLTGSVIGAFAVSALVPVRDRSLRTHQLLGRAAAAIRESYIKSMSESGCTTAGWPLRRLRSLSG